MKTIILSAFFVLALTVNSFSVEKNKIVNKETMNAYVAQSNFRAKYKDAQNVVWTEVDGYYKASFLLHGEKKSAFFDASGKYLATSDYVKADSLPAESLAKLKRYYKKYQLGEVLRYVAESTDSDMLSGRPVISTFYFVSLKSPKDHIAVKVTPENEIKYFQSL